MGKEVGGVSEAAPLDGPAAPGAEESPSVGAYLAGQRKQRGIDLDELEAATRIPRRSLERLEAGHFDSGADGFSRGFVRTVASALGLDPDESVERMRAEPPVVSARRALRPSLSALLLAAGGLSVVALGAALFMAVELLGGPPKEAGEPEIITRRDPVRALAEARGSGGLPRALAAAER